MKKTRVDLRLVREFKVLHKPVSASSIMHDGAFEMLKQIANGVSHRIYRFVTSSERQWHDSLSTNWSEQRDVRSLERENAGGFDLTSKRIVPGDLMDVGD